MWLYNLSLFVGIAALVFLGGTMYAAASSDLDSHSAEESGMPVCGISISKSSLTFTLVPGEMSETVAQSVYNRGSSSPEFVYLSAGAWAGPSGNIDGYITQWKHASEDDSQYRDLSADRTAVSELLPKTAGESLDIRLRVNGMAADPSVSTNGASQFISYMVQCSGPAPAPDPAPLDPSVVIHASQIESPEIPQGMADSNNEFAVRFYKQVADSGNNIFFSPTSMMVAFSLLNEGARGNTAAEIEQVFGLEPNATKRHNATAHMMASITREDPNATLDLANALWLAERFAPHQQYLDIARSTYLAGAETVDFADPDDGIKRINDWASESTRDKIKEAVGPDVVTPETVMVITNAIYFKGTWATQFSEDNTKKSAFYKSDSESVSADFMNMDGRFDYAEADGIKVLRMPYDGDRLSMLLVLPDGADEMNQLEADLSAEQIGLWIAQLENQEIVVSVPKFETKAKYDLKPLLMNMGVQDVFGPADLSGIGPGLFVSDAIQDAYIKVNEQGTEAAAVTVIAIAESEFPSFVADRPFLFTIYDEESRMILFM